MEPGPTSRFASSFPPGLTRTKARTAILGSHHPFSAPLLPRTPTAAVGRLVLTRPLLPGPSGPSLPAKAQWYLLWPRLCWRLCPPAQPPSSSPQTRPLTVCPRASSTSRGPAWPPHLQETLVQVSSSVGGPPRLLRRAPPELQPWAPLYPSSHPCELPSLQTPRPRCDQGGFPGPPNPTTPTSLAQSGRWSRHPPPITTSPLPRPERENTQSSPI